MCCCPAAPVFQRQGLLMAGLSTAALIYSTVRWCIYHDCHVLKDLLSQPLNILSRLLSVSFEEAYRHLNRPKLSLSGAIMHMLTCWSKSVQTCFIELCLGNDCECGATRGRGCSLTIPSFLHLNSYIKCC